MSCGLFGTQAEIGRRLMQHAKSVSVYVRTQKQTHTEHLPMLQAVNIATNMSIMHLQARAYV